MKQKLLILATAALLPLIVVAHSIAANNSTFNQTINAGTLTTDIMDASRVTVASPSVTMSAKTFSFDCYSGGSASTGTFGTDSERIYVTNPDAADAGWTLTVAATGGATTLWSSSSFDFNDPTSSGCTDGGDADSRGGQLTINPNAGTLTADCGSCATTNVTKGSSTAFNQGTTDSITMLTAAAGSDDVWRGYLTGATLSQTIPAETATGAFTLNMTLTVTAS
jgi:hypothetical protein